MAPTRHHVAARLVVRSPAARMITALARFARMSRALTAVAALAALMLSAPAARADCPSGTVIERIGNNVFCVNCPQLMIPNASRTACVCQLNTIAVVVGSHPPRTVCSFCPPTQVPDKNQKKCIPCPAGTTISFGQCITNTANSTPVGWPGLVDKTKPSPGLLESTPTFTPQGPAPSGTPIGPRPGAR